MARRFYSEAAFARTWQRSATAWGRVRSTYVIHVGDALFRKRLRERLRERKWSGCGSVLLQDLLWEELSAYAHMLLLARFKGVATDEIDSHINARLNAVNLGKVSGNAVTTFSGGMRRRLSVALSSIGDPDIIFMDVRLTCLCVCDCGRF